MLDATGGWPILMSEEEWDAKNYTWQKMDNDYFKLYTFPILFNILFSTDYENPRIMVYISIYILYILICVCIFACVHGYMRIRMSICAYNTYILLVTTARL